VFCDFCRSIAVVCGFDGPETEVVMTNGKETTTWKNTGGWASCEPCAQLLETGNLDELANRALGSDNNWSGMSTEVRAMYFELLKDQYEKINRTRRGGVTWKRYSNK